MKYDVSSKIGLNAHNGVNVLNFSANLFYWKDLKPSGEPKVCTRQEQWSEISTGRPSLVLRPRKVGFAGNHVNSDRLSSNTSAGVSKLPTLAMVDLSNDIHFFSIL